MNEFNAVSMDELTTIQGGGVLSFLAGAAAVAIGGPVFAAGAAIGYAVTSAAIK